MLKHAREITICNHYTDVNGRLGAKTLCDLFNDVANEQTLELGVDVETFNASGITWMLHRIRVEFARLPVKGERVVLETWPSGAGALFAFRDFAVVASSGEGLARGSSEWMVIDLERRRPVRLPQSVRRLELLRERIAPALTFTLDPRERQRAYEGCRRFVASYDTIDFNRHVTQASYVGWMTNALPFSFLSTRVLQEVEAVHEHEIMPDSEVDSFYAIEEQGDRARVSHRVVDATGKITHCVGQSAWTRHEGCGKE